MRLLIFLLMSLMVGSLSACANLSDDTTINICVREYEGVATSFNCESIVA